MVSLNPRVQKSPGGIPSFPKPPELLEIFCFLVCFSTRGHMV